MVKGFSDTEKIILKYYGKGFFDNIEDKEVLGRCRELEDKVGGSSKTYYNIFKGMEKYGTFELYYPNKFKKNYIISFATRLSKDTLNKLRDLKKETGKSIVELVNEAIETFKIK